jgi:hypothetical protein
LVPHSWSTDPLCLLQATNVDLEEMIGLVGSLKILATQLFEDSYLGPYGDDGDNDDGGGQGSATSRGRKRR